MNNDDPVTPSEYAKFQTTGRTLESDHFFYRRDREDEQESTKIGLPPRRRDTALCQFCGYYIPFGIAGVVCCPQMSELMGKLCGCNHWRQDHKAGEGMSVGECQHGGCWCQGFWLPKVVDPGPDGA
jgi:hypothetical protein